MSARSDSIARSNFEFQGPYLGPIVLVLGLPAICYGLIHACNGRGCIGRSSWHWPGLPEGTLLFSWQATAVYLAWLLLQVQTAFGGICNVMLAVTEILQLLVTCKIDAVQVGLHLVLPGQQADGVVLSNGKRLRYKLTGIALEKIK